MGEDGIKAIRYKTINQCLSAFFQCRVSELDKIEGHWEWMNANGIEEQQEVQESLKVIRKLNCWGFVSDKEVIHYFIRKKATMEDAVLLFAHELGHMQRPYHRTLKEEQKACKYADVALSSVRLATQLIQEGIIKGALTFEREE